MGCDAEDVCSICLTGFSGSIGKPNSCTHYFCLGCLKRWALANRRCPHCRTPFFAIVEFNEIGGEIIRQEVLRDPTIEACNDVLNEFIETVESLFSQVNSEYVLGDSDSTMLDRLHDGVNELRENYTAYHHLNDVMNIAIETNWDDFSSTPDELFQSLMDYLHKLLTRTALLSEYFSRVLNGREREEDYEKLRRLFSKGYPRHRYPFLTG